MKFIHVADLHLGMHPDANKPWGKNRDQELWDTFERLIEKTEEEKADLLLIAGDLFHRQPMISELRQVDYLFQKLSRTKVVLIAGNHDPLTKDSAYRSFSWSDHVFFIGSDKVIPVKVGDVWVYGFSYYDSTNPNPVYDTIEIQDPSAINILLGHGGDVNHCPFQPEELAKLGFSYLAFGHIHKPDLSSTVPYGMPGSLEPLDITETGLHGYIQGEISEEGICTYSFQAFSKRSYFEEEILCEPYDTELSIRDKILDLISMEGIENIYKIHLKGHRDVDLEFDIDKLQSLGNILLVDETLLDYDFEALYQMNQDNLLGLFIRDLKDKEDELSKQALYLGTRALLTAMEGREG